MSKVIKLSSKVYRVVVSTDKWGVTTSAVDIVKTKKGEWSIHYAKDMEIGETAKDTKGRIASKLRAAKAFAVDFANAVINDKKLPKISEDKYFDLERVKPKSVEENKCGSCGSVDIKTCIEPDTFNIGVVDVEYSVCSNCNEEFISTEQIKRNDMRVRLLTKPLHSIQD